MKVLVMDYFVRIRDLKLITAVNDSIEFVFVKTTDKNDNLDKLPGMKVCTVTDFNAEIMNIIRKESPDVLHTHVDVHAYFLLRHDVNIPIVHECHDPVSAYGSKPQDAKDREKIVMTRVDKIICVSKMMKNYLHSLYGVGNKCIIVHSLPNAKYLPGNYHKAPKIFNHGVYQGGMGMYKNHHRFYGDIFTRIAKQGIKLDTYSTHGDINYNISGIRSMTFISDISKLYSTLAGYHFEFVGFNRNYKSLSLLNMALPNKLFEAVAVGLPVLSMNYTSIASFVKSHGFGVIVEDNMKLPTDFQEQMQKAKQNVMLHGHEWTMQKEKNKLLDIYNIYK